MDLGWRKTECVWKSQGYVNVTTKIWLPWFSTTFRITYSCFHTWIRCSILSEARWIEESYILCKQNFIQTLKELSRTQVRIFSAQVVRYGDVFTLFDRKSFRSFDWQQSSYICSDNSTVGCNRSKMGIGAWTTFDIFYRAGLKNSDADGMRRYPHNKVKLEQCYIMDDELDFDKRLTLQKDLQWINRWSKGENNRK